MLKIFHSDLYVLNQELVFVMQTFHLVQCYE